MSLSILELANRLGWLFYPPQSRSKPVFFVSTGLPTDRNLLHETCAYVLSSRELEQLMPNTQATIICSGCAERDTVPKNLTCLYPPSHLSPLECEHMVIEALAEEEYYKCCEHRLYDAFMKRRGVHYIVDEAHAIFENPLFIMDNSYKTIAVAGHIQNDELWDEITNKGFYTLSNIQQLSASPVTTDSEKPPSPIITTDAVSPHPYIPFRIELNGKKVGFASLIQYNRPFRERDTELMELFCRLLGLELQTGSTEIHAFREIHQYILTDLLNGSINLQLLPQRLETANLRLHKYKFIVVIDLGGKGEKISQSLFGVDYIAHAIPNSYSVMYNNQIVVLVSTAFYTTSKEKLTGRLAGLLRDMNLSAGMSCAFLSLEDTRTYYNQAASVCAMGKNLHGAGTIYSFYDCQAFQLLENANRSCRLLEFCHPMLIKAKTYDEKYNTCYLQTIRQYLSSNFNAAETAQVLGVHRNTVDYRLGKVKELFEIDFQSATNNFLFELTFQILEYIELIEKSENI